MPMPRWFGPMNKRFFNPRAIASGKWPVLIHTGRTSCATHQTPMDANPIDGGYIFVPVYGPESDWVQNVLAAGNARLRVNGDEIKLSSPRLVGEKEAFALLSDDVPRPPKMLRIDTFLRMDEVS